MHSSGQPLVLMYHGVGQRSPATDPYNLFVPPEVLHEQLSTLLRRGWRPLRLADYIAGQGDRRSFLVTFDDGYRSVYQTAVPMLAELGVPATVFVLPGLLGGTSEWMPEMSAEPLMTAEEVLATRASGFELGLHGMDHTALAGLPPQELRRQVCTAAQALAELTGQWPQAFAYPYGDHDANARIAVAAAGLTIGFATHDPNGPLAVPRVDVNSTDSGATFRVKTLRAYPRLRRISGTVPGLRPMVRAVLGGIRPD